MYNVTLNNRDCIFDSADGFETFAEALKWANDRGGVYVAQFENTESVDYCPFTSVSIENKEPGDNRYSYYNGYGWQHMTAEQVAKLVG